MSAFISQNKLRSREQLHQWGVLALMALLLIGIVLFIFLVLLPDLNRRTEYFGALISIENDLRLAEQARAEAPTRTQARLVEAEGRLSQTAQAFLNEMESAIVVNRLYTYADDAGVEIVNLQATPPVIAPTHTQRNYGFQVAGTIEALMDFLGRIAEVNLPGFVVSNVAINPNANNPDASTEVARHLLTMNVAVLSSPYSTNLEQQAGQNSPALDPTHRNNVADLPLAEVQRQVELAWESRNWGEAIALLTEVTTLAPDNEMAKIALYRAHVNLGYARLTERDYAAAQVAFENAQTVDPTGREAMNELQQLANDNTLSHRVEDELRQAVQQARISGNWQEVIRLLRIIAAVDPAYGPVGDELTQAYISYGDQLASSGDSVRAAEQYQLAQYTPPGQADTGAVSAVAASEVVTNSAAP